MSLNLRVWRIINPPNYPTYYDVKSVEEAVEKINRLTDEDLKNPSISANAFGLEMFDHGDMEWTEFYDDYGRDIHQIMRIRRRIDMGKLRVVHVRVYKDTKACEHRYLIRSVDEAIRFIRDNTRCNPKSDRVWSDDFVLEEWDENCQAWMEYHDDEGRDIHEIMDEREKQSNNANCLIKNLYEM